MRIRTASVPARQLNIGSEVLDSCHGREDTLEKGPLGALFWSGSAEPCRGISKARFFGMAGNSGDTKRDAWRFCARPGAPSALAGLWKRGCATLLKPQGCPRRISTTTFRANTKFYFSVRTVRSTAWSRRL